MKITRKELASYLLTLQLVEAGYHITYDEIIDEIGVREFLSIPEKDRKLFFQGKLSLKSVIPKYQWFQHYTITVKQEQEWCKKAVKIVKDTLKCSIPYACEYVAWLNLAQGLRIKG